MIQIYGALVDFGHKKNIGNFLFSYPYYIRYYKEFGCYLGATIRNSSVFF